MDIYYCQCWCHAQYWLFNIIGVQQEKKSQFFRSGMLFEQSLISTVSVHVCVCSKERMRECVYGYSVDQVIDDGFASGFISIDPRHQIFPTAATGNLFIRWMHLHSPPIKVYLCKCASNSKKPSAKEMLGSGTLFLITARWTSCCRRVMGRWKSCCRSLLHSLSFFIFLFLFFSRFFIDNFSSYSAHRCSFDSHFMANLFDGISDSSEAGCILMYSIDFLSFFFIGTYTYNWWNSVG